MELIIFQFKSTKFLMKISEIKISYSTKCQDKFVIKSSNDAFTILKDHWNLESIELYEEFQILLLNRANGVLGIYHLSKGGVSGTIVDVKLIFSVALKCNASGIILVHNHPSGNTKPSQTDIVITSKIKKAADLLDINLFDHIILTKYSYCSFADEGLL